MADEPEVECCDCGWQGDESDLRNPGCHGDARYVDGEKCPECESDNIEDHKPEEDNG